MNTLNPSDYCLAAETMLQRASSLKIENTRYTSSQPIFLINSKKIRNLQECSARMMAVADQRTDAIDDYRDFVYRECGI